MTEPRGTEATIQVMWEGGMRYRGGSAAGGRTLLLDGERAAAPSPVEGVVVSLAACAAIDVVEILGKRRTPVIALEVHARVERALMPPRRITALDLVFRVETASERTHVERAIELSFEKYCSVAHTLAPDIRLTHTLELRMPSASSDQPRAPDPASSASSC